MNFVEGKDTSIEDAITRQCQDAFPSCYSLADSQDALCVADGSCCGDDQQELIAAIDEGEMLTTVHRVTEKIIQDFKGKLSQKQEERLNKADFVILNDEADGAKYAVPERSPESSQLSDLFRTMREEQMLERTSDSQVKKETEKEEFPLLDVKPKTSKGKRTRGTDNEESDDDKRQKSRKTRAE